MRLIKLLLFDTNDLPFGNNYVKYFTFVHNVTDSIAAPRLYQAIHLPILEFLNAPKQFGVNQIL